MRYFRPYLTIVAVAYELQLLCNYSLVVAAPGRFQFSSKSAGMISGCSAEFSAPCSFKTSLAIVENVVHDVGTTSNRLDFEEVMGKIRNGDYNMAATTDRFYPVVINETGYIVGSGCCPEDEGLQLVDVLELKGLSYLDPDKLLGTIRASTQSAANANARDGVTDGWMELPWKSMMDDSILPHIAYFKNATAAFDGAQHYVGVIFKNLQLPANPNCSNKRDSSCALQNVQSLVGKVMADLVSATTITFFYSLLSQISYDPAYRTGADDLFYVFMAESGKDTTGELVAHGANPELVGMNFTELLIMADLEGRGGQTGAKLHTLFSKAAGRGGGFVRYNWIDPSENNRVFEKAAVVQGVTMFGKTYYLAAGFEHVLENGDIAGTEPCRPNGLCRSDLALPCSIETAEALVNRLVVRAYSLCSAAFGTNSDDDDDDDDEDEECTDSFVWEKMTARLSNFTLGVQSSFYPFVFAYDGTLVAHKYSSFIGASFDEFRHVGSDRTEEELEENFGLTIEDLSRGWSNGSGSGSGDGNGNVSGSDWLDSDRFYHTLSAATVSGFVGRNDRDLHSELKQKADRGGGWKLYRGMHKLLPGVDGNPPKSRLSSKTGEQEQSMLAYVMKVTAPGTKSESESESEEESSREYYIGVAYAMKFYGPFGPCDGQYGGLCAEKNTLGHVAMAASYLNGVESAKGLEDALAFVTYNMSSFYSLDYPLYASLNSQNVTHLTINTNSGAKGEKEQGIAISKALVQNVNVMVIDEDSQTRSYSRRPDLTGLDLSVALRSLDVVTTSGAEFFQGWVKAADGAGWLEVPWRAVDASDGSARAVTFYDYAIRSTFKDAQSLDLRFRKGYDLFISAGHYYRPPKTMCAEHGGCPAHSRCDEGTGYCECEEFYEAAWTNATDHCTQYALNQSMVCVLHPPACREQDYSFRVSDCDGYHHDIEFYWTEGRGGLCEGGAVLPGGFSVNCAFLPYQTAEATSMVVLASVGAAYCFALIGWIVWNREKHIVKASQPLFCCIFTFGAAMVNVSTILAMGEPARGQCKSSSLVFHLGFTLAFSALLSKVFRVYLVFNNRKLRRRKLTNQAVLSWTGYLLLVDVCCMLVYLASPDGYTKRSVEVEAGRFGSFGSVECRADGHLLGIVASGFYKVCLIVGGCLLSYKMRKVDTALNESFYIFVATYNIATFGLLIMAASYMMEQTMAPAQYATMYTTLVVWVACSSVTIIIFPKWYRLFTRGNEMPSLTDSDANANAIANSDKDSKRDSSKRSGQGSGHDRASSRLSQVQLLSMGQGNGQGQGLEAGGSGTKDQDPHRLPLQQAAAGAVGGNGSSVVYEAGRLSLIGGPGLSSHSSESAPPSPPAPPVLPLALPLPKGAGSGPAISNNTSNTTSNANSNSNIIAATVSKYASSARGHFLGHPTTTTTTTTTTSSSSAGGDSKDPLSRSPAAFVVNPGDGAPFAPAAAFSASLGPASALTDTSTKVSSIDPTTAVAENTSKDSTATATATATATSSSSSPRSPGRGIRLANVRLERALRAALSCLGRVQSSLQEMMAKALDAEEAAAKLGGKAESEGEDKGEDEGGRKRGQQKDAKNNDDEDDFFPTLPRSPEGSSAGRSNRTDGSECERNKEEKNHSSTKIGGEVEVEVVASEEHLDSSMRRSGIGMGMGTGIHRPLVLLTVDDSEIGELGQSISPMSSFQNHGKGSNLILPKLPPPRPSCSSSSSFSSNLLNEGSSSSKSKGGGSRCANKGQGLLPPPLPSSLPPLRSKRTKEEEEEEEAAKAKAVLQLVVSVAAVKRLIGESSADIKASKEKATAKLEEIHKLKKTN